MNEPTRGPLSIAIPTYRREQVLLDTIEYLLALTIKGDEILVLDQTETHEPATLVRLQTWSDAGRLRWLTLPEPSITRAMNRALIEARNEMVLFVDDDIRPEPGLLDAHAQAQAKHGDGLVAGRVLQPWHEGRHIQVDVPFHFAACTSVLVDEFMGGNFSVRRHVALALGGFDENFVRVAYRFEAEFARRYRQCGRRILFEPLACIHHLKEAAGGTRTFGEHLSTWRPDHAVGAYYYALRTHHAIELLRRPFASVATRYHLRRPWRIPATLAAELAGLAWAIFLFARGPRLLRTAPP